MPELAFVFNSEGRLITWNNNVEVFFGFSESELKNKFVSEFIYEPDKERVLKKFMEVLADGEGNKTIEYRIKTKSGSIIPLLSLRSLVIIDSNEYVIGIATEISGLSKTNSDEKRNSHIAEIVAIKVQLDKYYQGIENINQAKVQLKEKLFMSSRRFSNKLIDSLPGIFYLYENIGGKFFLKKWNKNYETDLGYSSDKIYNIEPSYFFSEEEYEKAEKAIMEVFSSGSVQVEIFTKHYKGHQIPYYYEGYLFEDGGRSFFMGVGIDISNLYELRKKQKLQEKEKLEAQAKLEENKRELLTTALQVSRTSKIAENTLKQIDGLLQKHTGTEFYEDLLNIRKDLKLQSSEQDNWELFKLRFTEVHKDFFSNLLSTHPELTKSELKFCTYLRIHLSSSQIASALNVTSEAIKKTRYRIRKKIAITPKDSLEDYIAKF